MSRRECSPTTIVATLSIILFQLSKPATSQEATSALECPANYTGSDIAFAVFLTTLVLSIILAVALYAWRYYASKLQGQHLVLLSPDPEKGESVFAFDNPGFKEGSTAVNPSEKLNNHTKLKWPQWNIIPQGSPSKTKTMDDTFIANSAPLLTVVPLRSHDFTGLGFNICGNMRDGIFVKDVLHRGPASESGMIAAGDRLEAIKINLRHVVLEDALTILSYASPYEVELTLEPRKKEGASPPIHPSPPPHILGHPQFCKSHSISELHKLNKYYEPKRAESSFSTHKDINSSFERESKNSSPDRTKSPFEAKHTKQESFVEIPSPSNLEHLVKPTQVLEPERYQNLRRGNLEFHSFQRTENPGFIEISLGTDKVDKPSSPKEQQKSPQTNVKSVLVKGIKNLKEKLHNSLLLDDSLDSKGNSRHSTLEKRTTSKSPTLKKEDGFQTVELHVPEEVERAGEVVREKRRSVVHPEELIVNDPAPEVSDSEDPVAAKRNKRKAPRPPPESDVEELPECQRDLRTSLQFSTSRESLKSDDSAASGHNSGMTIELNSSHITVHQAPESESRKASSLGDLSKYEAENVTVLERAVSLDLGDGGAPGTKKRKAPLPPQEDGISPYKEAKIETPATGTLKKSSVWGTLEDMIQNGGSESETDLGISGCSTPENSPDKEDEIITSTPFKFSSNVPSENGISNIEVNNSDWEKSEFMTAINGDDTPPELPTSPMPQISSFITEIQVSCLKRPETTQVVHLDSTEGLLDHMASSMKIEPVEETITLSPVPHTRVDKRLSAMHTNLPPPAKSPPPVERQSVKAISPSPRNNVSVTSIKGQSRIPVRAGPRSPSSTLSPSSKRSRSNQRNGHVSP